VPENRTVFPDAVSVPTSTHPALGSSKAIPYVPAVRCDETIVKPGIPASVAFTDEVSVKYSNGVAPAANSELLAALSPSGTVSDSVTASVPEPPVAGGTDSTVSYPWRSGSVAAPPLAPSGAVAETDVGAGGGGVTPVPDPPPQPAARLAATRQTAVANDGRMRMMRPQERRCAGAACSRRLPSTVARNAHRRHGVTPYRTRHGASLGRSAKKPAMVVRPIVCTKFIGREEELRFLHERRGEAARSHGGVVFVRGEAGVGKSRLVRELCASLVRTRWRVGVGRCLEFAQRPYSPILELLERIDRAAPDLVPADSRREQFDAIVARFARAAERSALLAVVEDVHWADAATIEFLSYFASKLGTMRVLLVVSLRPEETHDEHPLYSRLANLLRTPGPSITLSPLTLAERDAFIDDALGETVIPAEARRHVAQAADGNPFFTEELLKSTVERAGSGSLPGTGALPTTVRAALMERLRPLDASERHVILQAAVVGRRFDIDTLRDTLDEDGEVIEQVLQRARRLQLIEEQSPGAFRFRHALTREAIYDQMLGVQLRPMHRKIAELLEQRPSGQGSLESLAYHWVLAGDDERGARYSELAGDAAAAVHAHEDAIALYERAAALLGANTPARAALLEKIAERQIVLGLVGAAYDAFADAAEIFCANGDFVHEAACRVQQAISAYSAGRSNPIYPLLAMLDRLPEDEMLARSRVHLGIAWITASFYEPNIANEHVDRVAPEAIAELPDIRLRVHNIRAWTAMTVGDTGRFRTELVRWMTAAERVAIPGALIGAHFNGSFCAAVLALHDDATTLAQRAVEIARIERNVNGERVARTRLAFAALLRGDVIAARDALQPLVPKPGINEVTFAHEAAWGSLTAAYLGDPVLMKRWFDDVFEFATPLAITLCGAGYAEIMARRGRIADARALLARSFPGLSDLARGMVFTFLAAARYGAAAEVMDARRRLTTIAALRHETPERYVLPLFEAHIADRHGDPAAARRFANDAVPGLQRFGLRLVEASARELAGERDAAIDLYQSCGAAYEVRRLAPDRAAAAVAPADARAVLSERERSIALLVAAGQSNVAIGRALSISHKTVEKHLGRVYEKLGFSTRAQLGAFVSSDAIHGAP